MFRITLWQPLLLWKTAQQGGHFLSHLKPTISTSIRASNMTLLIHLYLWCNALGIGWISCQISHPCCYSSHWCFLWVELIGTCCKVRSAGGQLISMGLLLLMAVLPCLVHTDNWWCKTSEKKNRSLKWRIFRLSTLRQKTWFQRSSSAFRRETRVEVILGKICAAS